MPKIDAFSSPHRFEQSWWERVEAGKVAIAIVAFVTLEQTYFLAVSADGALVVDSICNRATPESRDELELYAVRWIGARMRAVLYADPLADPFQVWRVSQALDTGAALDLALEPGKFPSFEALREIALDVPVSTSRFAPRWAGDDEQRILLGFDVTPERREELRLARLERVRAEELDPGEDPEVFDFDA